ncbi:MAG TPA: hypothetical protein VFQ20_14330 [Burkholderiaceae bacterium]|nr:hypothetical protein [Burkholderiaceae bacterium]
MSVRKLEVLAWVLIYGGILGVILGWFLAPVRGPWGELLITAGAVAATAGVALIFVRSRMKDRP